MLLQRMLLQRMLRQRMLRQGMLRQRMLRQRMLRQRMLRQRMRSMCLLRLPQTARLRRAMACWQMGTRVSRGATVPAGSVRERAAVRTLLASACLGRAPAPVICAPTVAATERPSGPAAPVRASAMPLGVPARTIRSPTCPSRLRSATQQHHEVFQSGISACTGQNRGQR